MERGSIGIAHEKLIKARKKSPNALTYALLAIVNVDMGNDEIADNYIQKALYMSDSARVLSIAGHVARQRGQFAVASENLIQAYNKLFSDQNSNYYYSVMFRHELFPLIFSPYARNDLLVFNFVQDDFIWLGEYLVQNNQTTKHSHIIKWVKNYVADDNSEINSENY